MGKFVISNARDKIRHKQGIIKTTQYPKGIFITTNPELLEELKTPTMRAIEKWKGMPIEHILLNGSLLEVSRILGVDKSTISKWIKKLHLRYDKDNLPSCDRCIRRKKMCNIKHCAILSGMGLLELQIFKRRELKSSERNNNGKN